MQSPGGVLILNDSIARKPYTDENDLICWHFDHKKGRHVKGINFLTALYCTKDVSFPVGFELVTKTKVVKDKKTGKRDEGVKKQRTSIIGDCSRFV